MFHLLTTYQIYFRLGCKYFYCTYLLLLYILPLLAGHFFAAVEGCYLVKESETNCPPEPGRPSPSSLTLHSQSATSK